MAWIQIVVIITELMPLQNRNSAQTVVQKWIRRKLMNWISVRDRLPEDQVEVLVATRSKNGVRNIDKGYLAIDHFIHRGRAEVTHWMPLPEFPKEEK